MGRYINAAELREPLSWCIRTAKKWSIPYTWCLIPAKGSFYFGPRDSTLTEKVRAMSKAIWGVDLTKGYTSKTGKACVLVDLTQVAPKPRNEWDWEVLAKI